MRSCFIMSSVIFRQSSRKYFCNLPTYYTRRKVWYRLPQKHLKRTPLQVSGKFERRSICLKIEYVALLDALNNTCKTYEKRQSTRHWGIRGPLGVRGGLGSGWC